LVSPRRTAAMLRSLTRRCRSATSPTAEGPLAACSAVLACQNTRRKAGGPVSKADDPLPSAPFRPMMDEAADRELSHISIISYQVPYWIADRRLWQQPSGSQSGDPLTPEMEFRFSPVPCNRVPFSRQSTGVVSSARTTTRTRTRRGQWNVLIGGRLRNARRMGVGLSGEEIGSEARVAAPKGEKGRLRTAAAESANASASCKTTAVVSAPRGQTDRKYDAST
jgi:hypothetical protein